MWAYVILELGFFTDGLWKAFDIDQVWITIYMIVPTFEPLIIIFVKWNVR